MLRNVTIAFKLPLALFSGLALAVAGTGFLVWPAVRAVLHEDVVVALASTHKAQVAAAEARAELFLSEVTRIARSPALTMTLSHATGPGAVPPDMLAGAREMPREIPAATWGFDGTLQLYSLGGKAISSRGEEVSDAVEARMQALAADVVAPVAVVWNGDPAHLAVAAPVPDGPGAAAVLVGVIGMDQLFGDALEGAVLDIATGAPGPALQTGDAGAQSTAFAFGDSTLVLTSRLASAHESEERRFLAARATLAGLVSVVVVTVLGLVLSARFASTVNRLVAMAESIRDGTLDDDEALPPRRDGLGRISLALVQLRQTLRDARETVRVATFKSGAVEATSAALMMTDTDFRILHMNQAIADLLRRRQKDFESVIGHFDPENLIGKSMDVFHRQPERIRALVADPSSLPFRTDIPLGEARLAITVNPIAGADGHREGMVIEWSDVTEERRTGAILDAIETGQLKAEFDLDGQLVSSNALFRQVVAGEAGTIRIANMVTMADGENGSRVVEHLQKGETRSGLIRLKSPQSEVTASVQGGFYPIRDRSRKVSGILMLGSDMTEVQATLDAAEATHRNLVQAQDTVVEALRVGLRHLSDGELSLRLDQRFDDRYEELRHDFNAALESLDATLSDFARETGGMQHETSEICRAAQEMAVRTERQAITLQETATGLDELTANVANTAEAAGQADGIVSQTRSRAEKSGMVVDEAEAAMAAIAASSREVVKVISVIDDIAFQTNLLALNAGVEAARAGEAGRGFAVVATEVRALAQRCANAAAEINALILASDQHVSRGVGLVSQAGEALKEIFDSISIISTHIADIARAAREQSDGLGQMNASVNEIEHATQQNAAMFEETNSASQELSNRAQMLSVAVGRFSVSADEPVSETASSPVTQKAAGRRSGSGTRGALALAPQAPQEIDNWEEF